MSLGEKDALALYEKGKHRRYSLLFSVNGGAFAIAKILAEGKAVGGLSDRRLSIGMVLFTLVMAVDIFAFGWRSRKAPIPYVFGFIGWAVVISLSVLICIGWVLLGFVGAP
jgi:hypothetical protein